MQSAGGSYNWAKNTIGRNEIREAEANGKSPYYYLDKLIEKSPVGSNGVIFLPYLQGERAPRWNPDARGAFIGLKSENNEGDMLRSVLEGVTMNLSIIFDIFRKQVNIDEILVIGGGAKGPVWRKIMSDVFNTRILVSSLLEEAASMGAAVTGGVGVGLYKDFNVIDKFLSVDAVHTPDRNAAAGHAPVKELFDDCYHILEGIYKNGGKNIASCFLPVCGSFSNLFSGMQRYRIQVQSMIHLR